MVFLKLMLELRSMAPVSYSAKLSVNSTSAEVGSLSTTFRLWFPGFRRSGPSCPASHNTPLLL